MPDNKDVTTYFGADISDLKKAMQDAKRAVAVANSEFQVAASSMDDWSKSSDGLGAKLKQLNSNLDSQKSVLANLEEQYRQVTQTQDKSSKAAQDLEIKINKQKAAINKTEKEIDSYEQALDDLENSSDDAAEATEELGDSAEDAGDGFTTLKGTIATFAGNVLTSLVGSIKDAIGSLAGLADETREYRNEMAKLETAFETAGFTGRATEQTYKDLYAILGDEGQTVEAANMLAKLCDTSQDLSEWTNIAAGVYGTFGASLPIESLAEAANETSKTGALTGALADALNWAGVNEDDFQASLDKCNSEQERQALITETLNGLYSDAAAKYKETNKSVMDANRANSDYADTVAEIGAIIEPVTTAVKKGFTEVIKKARELVGDVDIQAFTAKVEEGFGVLANTVLPAVKDGLGWIIDNKDVLIGAISAIAGGFVAFKAASIVSTAIEWVKGLGTGLTILKGIMAALGGPITIIITIIGALVAAFITLWNTSDEFRAFWINLWEKIKGACGAAKDWIAEKIKVIARFFTSTLPQAIDNTAAEFKALPGKIATWLQNAITKIIAWGANMISSGKAAARQFIDSVVALIKELPQSVWTWLQNVVSKVASWGSSMASKGRQAAQELVTSVVNKISELPGKMAGIGEDVVRGIWNGIDDMTGWIANKISGFVGDVEGWFKDFFGIASPSKLMRDQVGKWIPEGIAVGIDKNAKSVLSSVRDLTASTVGAARNGISGVGRVVSPTMGGNANSAAVGGTVNNFYQTINSPKQLKRLDVYRNTKNLLGYAGGAR